MPCTVDLAWMLEHYATWLQAVPTPFGAAYTVAMRVASALDANGIPTDGGPLGPR